MKNGKAGQTPLTRLCKTWTRSDLSLLTADFAHFHDELEDDLSGPERLEFLDMRERLGKLVAAVADLLPVDVASIQKHDRRTVLLTPPECDGEPDDE